MPLVKDLDQLDGFILLAPLLTPVDKGYLNEVPDAFNEEQEPGTFVEVLAFDDDETTGFIVCYADTVEDFQATLKQEPFLQKFTGKLYCEVPSCENVVRQAALPSTLIGYETTLQGQFVDTVNTVVELDVVPFTMSVMVHFPVEGDQWEPLRNDAVLQERGSVVWQELGNELLKETTYPSYENMFYAFSAMGDKPPKVLILGQDPYHTPGTANGLAFSVNRGCKVPPSLRNIFKALENDIDGFSTPKHGDLTKWAQEGVLMLNTALSVEQGKPGSHLKAWQPFTERLIEVVTETFCPLVILLWGGKAKALKKHISGVHNVLEFVHPSPLGSRGQFERNCKHFSETNRLLGKGNEIDWLLTE